MVGVFVSPLLKVRSRVEVTVWGGKVAREGGGAMYAAYFGRAPSLRPPHSLLRSLVPSLTT